MKKLVLPLLAAAALVTVPLMTAYADNAPMPTVGQAAPTFTLPSQTGAKISLKSYRGKWVVLYFYPKDMTSGCTLEAHNFQRDLKKFEAENAVVLGVSVDTVQSHQEFCTKDGLTFHLLADPDTKVVQEYGSLGHFGKWTIAERHTFLINPKGHIVRVWTDVDKDIMHHSQDVLAALETAKK
ncbi:MAG TPA: peroxiredoxin [Terracidiphilus sp.]|nr:peroxiredoxin [Terracidiphilus sp.]